MHQKSRKSPKSGKITPNGVKLEPHEYDTILFLTQQGYNIELIPPSNAPHSKSADFIMHKQKWEAKAPRGKGKYLIRDTILRAMQQSPENIILDLRRIKLHEAKCIHEIQKYFDIYDKIKNLLIITKDHKLIDMKRSK